MKLSPSDASLSKANPLHSSPSSEQEHLSVGLNGSWLYILLKSLKLMSIKYWVQEAVVPTLFIVGMLAIVAGVFALQAMRYGGIL